MGQDPASFAHASPSAAPSPAPAGPPGLSAEQLGALQAARHDGRKIARAAGVAAISGWTLAAFAGITLLSGIFSLPALLLGIGMAVVARVELLGSKALRRFDRAAPRRLAFNQAALAGMLTIYGGWGILAAVTGPGPYDEQIARGGEVAAMIEPIAALHLTVTLAVYGAVIAGGLVATGGAALYYITRTAHIDAHLGRTPGWVIETVRAAA